MPEEEKRTPEQKRNDERKVALHNLKDRGITDLAAPYLLRKTGEYVESAVHDFKYLPLISSPTKSTYSLIAGRLLDSREDGERYTGSVSESYIRKKASEIIDESLGRVTVNDILKLMGSEEKIKDGYGKKYLSDLRESENEEDKKIFDKVANGYLEYLNDIKDAEALSIRAGLHRGGLEEILVERKTQNGG